MPDSFVHDRDVKRLLEILEDAHELDADDLFYASVLDEISELVPADQVTFQVNAWHRGFGSLIEVSSGQRDQYSIQVEDIANDPLFGPDGCGALSAVHGYTGVTCETDAGSTGPVHELIAFMSPLGEFDRRSLFFRHGGPVFSDREQDLLRLARPHLAELHLRRVSEQRGAPRLTTRQWANMRLVATGATNAQVAHQMGIAEGTVRKHLENVFVRLEVSSRMEAVNMVFPH